jgi:hypothetical protein
MVLPGDCTHARGRSSRGALAHSRGYSAGYYCRGGLGGILYCGALDGLYSALQGAQGGPMGGAQGYARALRRYSWRSLGVLKRFYGVRWGTQGDSEVALRARVCVCVLVRVRANGGRTGTRVIPRRPAVFIARPVTGGRTRVRMRWSSVVRPCAAGATWTLVIANAPWGGRAYHTTVIDAAGAIYVIGGLSGVSTVYKDVWMSTDGGADRTRGG